IPLSGSKLTPCASAVATARRASEAASGSSWSAAISDSTARAVTTAYGCTEAGTWLTRSSSHGRASAGRPDRYNAWPSADPAQADSAGWSPANSNARLAAAVERPTSSKISVARARAAPNACECMPSGGGQPAFGVLLGGALESAAPGGDQGHRGISQDRRLRQAFQPAGHGRSLSAEPVGGPVPGDQRPRLAELAGGGGVVDGLIDLAGCLMPGRGPPMQHRHQGRFAGAKL